MAAIKMEKGEATLECWPSGGHNLIFFWGGDTGRGRQRVAEKGAAAPPQLPELGQYRGSLICFIDPHTPCSQMFSIPVWLD